MVDADSVLERLRRLERWLSELEAIHELGEEAYLQDADRRYATERRLQLAEQTCIDIAAHLLAEFAGPTPAEYAAIFPALVDAGVLGADLASRLARMASQRNILVHDYLELDDRIIFRSLAHLEDLREFASVAERLAKQEP